MRWLSFLIVLFLSTSVFSAEIDVRDIKIDGADFVAFDHQSALKLLQMRMDYPKLELKIDRLNELVILKDQEISLLDKIQENHKKQIFILVEKNVSLQKKIDTVDAWYNSKWLWTGIGILIGTGVTIGVAYAVK